MSSEFQTLLYAALSMSIGALSWLLIDTLRGLRDAIKDLNTSFSAVSGRVHNHETRLTVLERGR
jgi:hypothetical protein